MLTLAFLAGNQQGGNRLWLGNEKVNIVCYGQRVGYSPPTRWERPTWRLPERRLHITEHRSLPSVVKYGGVIYISRTP